MSDSPRPGIGVALVAHDLKNTFQLMTAALQALQPHLHDDEEATRAYIELRWLLAHVDYLATTLTDGLRSDLAQRRAIAINDFLVEREERLVKAVPAGVSFSVRPAAVSGSVLATTAELEWLVLALVDHACAAMPTGGEVTILTGWLDQVAGATLPSVRPRRYVRLTVSDTGDRADRDPNTDLVKISPTAGCPDEPASCSIAVAVRRLNGWLIVESEPHSGTRVHVCLPALPDPLVP